MIPAAFQHITPALRVFSGAGSLTSLARELDRLKAGRVVVFCGRTLGRAGSPLDLVLEALGDRCVGVFDQVAGHSPVPVAIDAATFMREQEADAAIAVGGGSAIVTARAASILAAEGKSPFHLATSRGADGVLHSPRLMAAKIPQLIVPTTPTTAMVKAGTALFDPETGARLALFDPKTRAQVLAFHPDLIASSPVELMISAGLNTFAMAVEGLVSRTGDPFADAALIHALRLSRSALPALRSGDEERARSDLMVAAALCGQGTDHAGAGLTTVLGHAIGARCGLENGTVNAVVLPYVLAFNGDANPSGLAKVAVGLGLPEDAGAEAVVTAVSVLFAALELPSRLGGLGMPPALVGAVAEGALSDWFLGGNPRPIGDAAEIQAVLEAAW